MLFKRMLSSLPTSALNEWTIGAVNQIRNLLGLPITTYVMANILSTDTFIREFIKGFLGIKTIGYTNSSSVLESCGSFADVVTKFNNDYNADPDVWFLTSLFDVMHTVAANLDTIDSLDRALLDNQLVDLEIFQYTKSNAWIGQDHSQWLGHMFKFDVSEEYLSQSDSISFFISGQSVAAVVKDSEEKAMAFSYKRITTDDLMLSILSSMANHTYDFSYQATKDLYMAATEEFMLDDMSSVAHFFLSYKDGCAGFAGHLK